MNPVTIETIIKAPLSKVWEYWNEPKHIEQRAFASDEWEASDAVNDLRVGSKLKTRMSAKDKSAGFDFVGTYTKVQENKLLEYDLDDGRHVKVEFIEYPGEVKVIQMFDAENENSIAFQRSGWQAILDNFKKHVENM